MKKIFAAAAVVTALATPAMSADMAVKARAPIVNPAYDWSGFYFGFGVGGGWADFERSYPSIATTISVENTHLNYVGFGGVQKQFGDWVFGVEGSWNNNFRDLDAPAPAALAAAFPGVPATLGFVNQIDDVATFGGRVGYAGWNNWMVYATGGWASARLSANYTWTGGGVAAGTIPSLGGTERVSGWYAGAGVEYVVHKGVIADTILGAEYQHLDFNQASGVFADPDANKTYRADLDVVRARLSFKFNPWRAAPVAVVAKY